MISLLDSMGPALWRATWQGAVLALLVALILRAFGDRLTPRWRFLLWSLVLVRLLVVITPASPWSLFNLAEGISQRPPRPVTRSIDQPRPMGQPIVLRAPSVGATNLPARSPDSERVTEPVKVPIEPVSVVTPASSWRFDGLTLSLRTLSRLLTAVWLAGGLVMGTRLIATALILRRRLAACQPVRDPVILELLESCRQQMGLKRAPELLVTPEALSPCVVGRGVLGVWQPQIVLPESVLADASPARLKHVLAHELAHLVRGDLWSNWLLLAVRVAHWFNPVAWWTVREMQAEREAACDELAFVALGESERTDYAATILELAAGLVPSPIAPGLIGLFSSAGRLKARLERVVRSPGVKGLRTPLVAGLLLTIALLGLTDSMPAVLAQAPKEPAPNAKEDSSPQTYTFTGICYENWERKPLSGVTVRLYREDGLAAPTVEVAKTVTDANGRYTFTGLVPPRPYHHLNRLRYGVLGFAEGRPIGQTFHHHNTEGEEIVELRMVKEAATLKGTVLNAAGKPVAGASIGRHSIGTRVIPGLPGAKTDADGRFTLENMAVYKTPDGQPWGTTVYVEHPDAPQLMHTVKSLPADVTIKLSAGCVVTGVVIQNGKPVADAVVTARRLDQWGEVNVATDAEGRFRMVVVEGRYDFLAEAMDRVCVAQTGKECLKGQSLELPPMTMTAGGFISGKVINTATKQPVTVTEKGEPIGIGYMGPSQPNGRAISPLRLAFVGGDGRYTLRAAAGENFPYFVNIRGDRMGWNTTEQPAVVVKEGETTLFDMLITPESLPEDRMAAARKAVAALPKGPAERTAAILGEFRKLNHTVDETEMWCSLMQELVTIGPAAVPQLCAELDATTEQAMLRRLGFALRAIGDPRSVPAIIRNFPKTLLPASSDYGLDVGDKGLLAFMQAHDLDKGKGGVHFNFGRPIREMTGTLHQLTGQSFADNGLNYMFRSADPRRQILQRRIFESQARQYEMWWEANWQKFTKDPTYAKCRVVIHEEPLPAAVETLSKSAKVIGTSGGSVLSPPTEKGQYAQHSLDLDTSYAPLWPAALTPEKVARDPKAANEWAAMSGADLICVVQKGTDGTETYVLRAVGMKVREISSRDLRNIDSLIASGNLPEGRAVDELLMHFDEQTQKLIPNANGAYLYVTREGSLGIIEVTDRITRTANLTGLPSGSGEGGVGFFKGVQFNLKEIVP